VDLVIVGYPQRLVADHAALMAAASAGGFRPEVVAPSRLSLATSGEGTTVLVDGHARTPVVALPRGVNRPWPMLRHVLAHWEQQGCIVVPSVQGAELCADKVATTVALATAGVPVLPTRGIIPGDGVVIDASVGMGPLVVKPARASKAIGVEAHPSATAAQQHLRSERPLVGGMVDHQVVQALATGAGCDYRVVVAHGEIAAVTQRMAPPGDFVTNRDGAEVVDIDDPYRTTPDVVEVAIAAATALQLGFAGVDVIHHEGRAVVLEVNAWPGLAAQVKSDQLAKSLVEVARRRLGPT
jgi:glutathione synthase/RimK-type ligase-like ATP-grasp enzyme